MQKLISLYKPLGKTPLDTIKEFKASHPEYKNKKMGYAGRLDPMAHGVLLVMVEPETKNRSKYQNLDKVYEFETIWGVSSDSHDILGVPNTEQNISLEILENELPEILKDYTGTFTQQYPIFSSKTVKGKPLFWWAKQARLNEIDIPEKEVEIYKIEVMKMREISSNDLSKEIVQRISQVQGDFRQEEILARWKVLLDEDRTFPLIRLRVHCGSGMYVRSLTDTLGRQFKTGALTLEILRTKVGDFELDKN